MGTISRPPKGGGATTYAGAVAAGFLDIIDSDVDNDFARIYGEFNGHITDANVATGAAIQRSKLALTGGIGNTDIAPNSLDAHHVLVPGTVTSTEIANNTITAADIQVGQTTPGSFSVAVTVGPIALANTETLIAEATYTARGGQYFAHGTLGGYILCAGITVNTTLRLKLGGSPGLPDGFPPDAAQNQALSLGLFTFPMGMTVMQNGTSAAGTARLKLTMTCDNANLCVVQSGRLVLIEFA